VGRSEIFFFSFALSFPIFLIVRGVLLVLLEEFDFFEFFEVEVDSFFEVDLDLDPGVALDFDLDLFLVLLLRYSSVRKPPREDVKTYRTFFLFTFIFSVLTTPPSFPLYKFLIVTTIIIIVVFWYSFGIRIGDVS
jgi:hypothetical protein